METNKIKSTIRAFSISTIVVIGLFITYMNFPVLGSEFTFYNQTELTPIYRVTSSEVEGFTIQSQIDDLVYFSVRSKEYNRVRINLTFKTNLPGQKMNLGYHDMSDYHFYSVPINSSGLNEWEQTSLEFSLQNAYYNKEGFVSWRISAPHLKEFDRHIDYKDIQITLIKDPIIKFENGKLSFNF